MKETYNPHSFGNTSTFSDSITRICTPRFGLTCEYSILFGFTTDIGCMRRPRYKSPFTHLGEILCIVIAIVWILCMVIAIFSIEISDPDTRLRNLGFDGYELVPGGSKSEALKRLPKGYQYLNYRYTIDGCSLSTFHRDVTSSPYIFKTKHPVYTFIVYTTPGKPSSPTPLLSVCPGSHLTVPFLYSNPVIISSTDLATSKTGVLFHCDLVHAGALIPHTQISMNRHVQQYKIAHADDLDKLAHLNNINMTKSGTCEGSYIYEWFSRRVSWMFSYIINHRLTPYLQTRPDTPFGQWLVSVDGRDFYNQ